MDVYEQVVECIAMVLRVDVENVKKLPQDQPLRVVGMDSMNCVDIVVNLEQEFDISFNDEELLMENINTVEKLVKIIEQKKIVK